MIVAGTVTFKMASRVRRLWRADARPQVRDGDGGRSAAGHAEQLPRRERRRPSGAGIYVPGCRPGLKSPYRRSVRLREDQGPAAAKRRAGQPAVGWMDDELRAEGPESRRSAAAAPPQRFRRIDDDKAAFEHQKLKPVRKTEKLKITDLHVSVAGADPPRMI